MGFLVHIRVNNRSKVIKFFNFVNMKLDFITAWFFMAVNPTCK
jgi:hypothetical protein